MFSVEKKNDLVSFLGKSAKNQYLFSIVFRIIETKETI